MPALTTTGSPTLNGDSSCTIDQTGSDHVTAPVGTLDETQSWWAMRFRAGESMATMAARSPTPVFFDWADASGTWILAFVEGDQSVRLLRANGGVGAVVSKAATWSVGGDVTVVFQWTATLTKVSVNGSAFTTVANTNIPTLADTTFDIGSLSDATRQINSAVWWAAAGTGSLSDADAATLSGFGNTDPAFASVPGTPIFLWKADDFNYETTAAGAPGNTVTPQVTGTMEVGQVVKVAQTGTWTNSPTSFSYQWQVADTSTGTWADIAAATSSSFTLTVTQLGKWIRCQVTGTNASGSNTASSNVGYDVVLASTTVLPTSTQIGFATGGNFFGRTQTQRQLELADMALLAPGGWVRLELNWSQIETSKGTFNWATYDAVLSDIQNAGFNVLLGLLFSPAWAVPAGSPSSTPPTNNQDLADFATAAVNRYKPGGTLDRNVQYWEVWNEPNISAFWGGAPNVTKYAGLLSATYDAIKAAQPTAIVLMAGLAPFGQYGNSNASGMNPKNYLEGIYAAGVGSKFDGVTWHTYTSTDVHDYEFSVFSGWSDLEASTPSVRSIMVANGQSTKPIWVTEHGIPIGLVKAGSVVDQQWQADFVTEGYSRWGQFTWNKGALIYFSYRPETADVGAYQYGIVDSSAALVKRRGWYAYRDFARVGVPGGNTYQKTGASIVGTRPRGVSVYVPVSTPAVGTVLFDETHQNHGNIIGSPTLVAGALRQDTNQALSYNATTSSTNIPSSTSSSLAVGDGGVGGMALECFVRFAALPGSTKNVIYKNGSYYLKIRADGKLELVLQNGAQSVTVTGTTVLATNTWYHVVGVYNGDYTGATTFGKTTTGSVFESLPPDYIAGTETSYNNLQANRHQVFEKGLVTSVVMDIQRDNSHPYSQWVAAVLYADAGGQPGPLLAQSDPVLVDAAYATRQWVTFPMSATVYQGFYWPGFVGGNAFTGASEYPVVLVGKETSGGTRRYRHDAVTSAGGSYPLGAASDPFGTSTPDSILLAVYANYTALARTGAEGKALLYVNGALDNSVAYTHGIAATASDTFFAPTDGTGHAVQLDEVSIWNKKLTASQVAAHYNAR